MPIEPTHYERPDVAVKQTFCTRAKDALFLHLSANFPEIPLQQYEPNGSGSEVKFMLIPRWRIYRCFDRVCARRLS